MCTLQNLQTPRNLGFVGFVGRELEHFCFFNKNGIKT